MGKVVIGIIAIVVLMILFPMVLTATHDIQTDDQTDAGLPCLSSPEDVVLTEDLWQADIDNVLSGVDDEGNILTATGYIEATKTLTVTGWVTPATTCTIVYEVDGLTEYTGMGALVGISPLLIWLAVLASVLGGLFFTIKGKFFD